MQYANVVDSNNTRLSTAHSRYPVKLDIAELSAHATIAGNAISATGYEKPLSRYEHANFFLAVGASIL